MFRFMGLWVETAEAFKYSLVKEYTLEPLANDSTLKYP